LQEDKGRSKVLLPIKQAACGNILTSGVYGDGIGIIRKKRPATKKKQELIMSLDPDKSKRPSRSPEVKKRRNLSFFITVLAAIAFAAWQISQSS